MSALQRKDRRFFEITLIGVVVAMALLAAQLGGYKLVVLNLFYLPIILSAYFLGRTSGCVLALLAALVITIVTTLDPTSLSTQFTTLLGGLAIAIWAAVLGLAAILIGTLCDERAATVEELHEAYVGVVEVLSKYLQGGNPRSKARSVRVAELSQLVAAEMRLSRKQIDDIRVGALLYDLGNVEITTKLITKAVDTLESSPQAADKHTFAGTDLVHSLGTVFHGAMPLLATQDQGVRACLSSEDDSSLTDLPLGAKIIHSVRAYDALVKETLGQRQIAPEDALHQLRNGPSGEHDEAVLKAIERVVCRTSQHSAPEAAYV